MNRPDFGAAAITTYYCPGCGITLRDEYDSMTAIEGGPTEIEEWCDSCDPWREERDDA